VGRNFLAPPYYSQCAVFASPLSGFSLLTVVYCATCMLTFWLCTAGRAECCGVVKADDDINQDSQASKWHHCQTANWQAYWQGTLLPTYVNDAPNVVLHVTPYLYPFILFELNDLIWLY